MLQVWAAAKLGYRMPPPMGVSSRIAAKFQIALDLTKRWDANPGWSHQMVAHPSQSDPCRAQLSLGGLGPRPRAAPAPSGPRPRPDPPPSGPEPSGTIEVLLP